MLIGCSLQKTEKQNAAFQTDRVKCEVLAPRNTLKIQPEDCDSSYAKRCCPCWPRELNAWTTAFSVASVSCHLTVHSRESQLPAPGAVSSRRCAHPQYPCTCLLTPWPPCHHRTHREHYSVNSKLKHSQGVVVRQWDACWSIKTAGTGVGKGNKGNFIFIKPASMSTGNFLEAWQSSWALWNINIDTLTILLSGLFIHYKT